MTTENSSKDDKLIVQEHCVDLPGESVQCWLGGGTDKLRVVLRKHRDIIFDINLGNGKTYTLETTESDYYNARDKKLIYAARNGKTEFKDSERFHVWVSRGFRGALVLKLDGRTIFKVEPNKWDTREHSDDPREKPAPIIVALGKSSNSCSIPEKIRAQSSDGAQTSSRVKSGIRAPNSASLPMPECSWPVVCVIDGKTEGMPKELLQYFTKGGDGTGFSDIDNWGVATRNWIWGQVAGFAAYAKDNWAWLKASADGKTSSGFKLVKAQVHYVRGKIRFYFSGYSSRNMVFGGGGFGPGHDRIMTIFSGMGKTKSLFKSALNGISGTFKASALVSFIFGSATAIAEWKDDVRKDGYDLSAALITTVIKTVLAAAATTLVLAVILWFVMVVIGIGVPVLMVGAVTIGIGMIAGYGIDAVDKEIGRRVKDDPTDKDGTATIVASWLRNAGAHIQQSWDYLAHKMSVDYREITF